MSDFEQYWRNAADAQRMADNSLTAKNKAAWLLIAERWLRLLSTQNAWTRPKQIRSQPKLNSRANAALPEGQFYFAN